LRSVDLDELKAGGVFVCSTSSDGTNYIRWSVTTDPTEINVREEMIRRNVDMFVLNLIKDTWGQFLGNANITDYLLATLTTTLNSLYDRIARTTSSDRLGPAILSAEVLSLKASETIADRVEAEINFTGPAPDNHNNLVVNL
jgi:hypothetical protein